MLVDGAALEVVRERLARAGFGPDRCDVLHGEAGLERIDLKGEAHGSGGTFIRALQGLFSDDAGHGRRYAEHLREGHDVVGVSVGEHEGAKQRAADALLAGGPQRVDYYAGYLVEDLGPNR